MTDEKDKLITKEDFLKKIKDFFVSIFSSSKKEKDSKDSYMDVYKKQSTEKTVRGTQLMLQYVANKGLKISPEIINVLTFTKEKIERSKKLTPKEEAKFWVAYSELSNQIQPVTVKSLKCIREEFGVYTGIFRKKKKISYAERVQGFYRKTGIGVLILVLLTQVFWLWQNYILKEANTNNTELKTTLQKLHEFRTDEKDKDKLYNLEIRKMELSQKLSIQKKNLDNYTSVKYFFCYPLYPLSFIYEIKFCSQKENSNRDTANNNAKSTIESSPAKEIKEETKKATESNLEKEKVEFKNLFDEEYMNNLQELTFSVQILTLYLLPLAYGLLGSCTYILRVIAYEIDKQIYVREHDIQYALRTLLGTFAGFVIGWFISSDAEIGVGFSPAKLSPFAIAFLAGYSVELLFTVLDKIVAVYSGAEKKKQEEKETKE